MALSSSQLEAFLAVAQTRSFTKAADRLHVTQSALSQRILNLEAEIESGLFIRDRAGLKITEVGHELLRYCQAKEALEGEFIQQLKAATSADLAGVIRIAGFSSVMRSVVLPILTTLQADHPALRLEVSSRETNELPDLLKRGEVDFIVLDGTLEREDLKVIALGDELNVLVEKKNYKGRDVYLDHDENDQVTARYLKLQQRKSVKIQRHYLDDVYGLIDGVRLGLGRSVLPKHLIRGFKDLRIIHPETVLRIPANLHFYQAAYYSKLHQAVVEALSREVPKLLASAAPLSALR